MRILMLLHCLLLNNTRKHLDKVSQIFRKILPIYWAFLTYMLLKPGVENKEYWFMFPGLDKLVHLSIFAALGFCLAAAFPRLKFLYYCYIILIYAFLTEILQDEMRLGRSGEWLDIVADAFGFFIGYYFFRFSSKRYL